MVGRRRFEPESAGPAPLPGDEVPDSVVERAKSAFARRAPSTPAPLVFDSATDAADEAGERSLRFEHPGGWVELTVSVTGAMRTIRGTASPAPQRVELEPEGGELAVWHEVSAGSFSFSGVPHGVLRLRVVGPPGSSTVYTEWVRV